jgi:hypothetical protein
MSASIGTEDREFAAVVDAWTLRLLDDVDNFPDLLRALPGVDPVVVSASLDRLVSAGPTLSEKITCLRRTGDLSAQRPTPRPVPHPLDFYWPHDPKSIDLLIEMIATRASPGDPVAHLGTPNVFTAAITRLPDRRHVLFDRSAQRANALQSSDGEVVRVDLLAGAVPQLNAPVALIDPPWYLAPLRGFLWAAAAVLRQGGEVLASLPPAGTRPSARAELDEILSWAAAGGLTVAERREQGVRYLSPPFERASQQAAGVLGVPDDWRCGELVVLRLDRPFEHARPTIPPDEQNAPWIEFLIDEIPIWVRDRDDGSDVPQGTLLTSLVDGDVLPSVSSRDPVRRHADLWTSLNRVWASSSTRTLQAICTALADHSSPCARVAAEFGGALTPAETALVREAASTLTDVIALERQEHGL